MTTEEKYNMFWNRKKSLDELESKATESLRKKCEEHQRENREAMKDISQPIKAFLSASDRWELGAVVDVDFHVKSSRIATDPETGLSLRITRWEGIEQHYSCDNHSWVTFEESVAVWEEFGRVVKEWEEGQDRKIRQKWTEAYKNLGEV